MTEQVYDGLVCSNLSFFIQFWVNIHKNEKRNKKRTAVPTMSYLKKAESNQAQLGSDRQMLSFSR
jgi:hypothetical protein